MIIIITIKNNDNDDVDDKDKGDNDDKCNPRILETPITEKFGTSVNFCKGMRLTEFLQLGMRVKNWFRF